ncbi:MAG: hypothetical protein LBC18_00050 [Opitutaceae bacterium]|jgi:hypothetical protein|nr:hypothetical protein [Opitutaceae bacterium]
MNEKPGDKPPQIIIHETDDSVAKVSVRLDGEAVWLTPQQLADLYGTSRPNVTMHIKNILAGGELNEDAVCKEFWLITVYHGSPRENAIRLYECKNHE